MGVESPAKMKARLSTLVAAGAGGPCFLPTAMPRQSEPQLWPYKMPLVVLTLASLATVVLSPWPRYQHLLWLLVFFSSCSLLSVMCQAVRMVSTVRKYRALYLHAAGGGSSPSSGTSSTSSSTTNLLGPAGGIPGGKLLVEASRPCHGHGKKAVQSLRVKGHHRPQLSLDAVDSCDQGSEAVALVVDCGDWSESGSGSDWSAAPPRWNHVFVLPNYKEDMETLCGTLEQLGSHAWAHTYTIVLAMEAKEASGPAKGAALQEQFGSCFHSVVYTQHVLDPSEMPGKASNVNAAVRQFWHMVSGDRSSYMLTIMDADALVPFEYIQQLESVSASVPNAGGNIYAAPVLFEQDASAVPGIVRATDYMWGALATQNLNSWFGVGFPISNYSLSLKLVHDIGYWDTFCDAIGEDMHMFNKAFLRTNGAARLYPLHAPINMCHIQGPSYLRSIWARFLQAERHMRGIADTAYVLHEWPGCSFSLRKLILFIACLEAHLIPVVTLTSLVILPVYFNLWQLAATGAIPSPMALPLPMRVLGCLGQGNLVFVIILLASYEQIRGIVRRHVYRMCEPDRGSCIASGARALLGALNYLTLFVSVWIYTVVPVVLVVSKHMFNVRSMNYVVADKRLHTAAL